MFQIEARKETASRTARRDAVFAALADPTRRTIIERLSRSEARVIELAEPFPMSLNAVSKHIRVLEASGVVERHRKGRDHILSINTRSLDEVDGWIARTRRFWEKRPDAMERLLNLPTGRCGLATSTDGIHWDRVKGPLTMGAVFEPSPDPDRFDSTHVGISDVTYIDGLYWMWYFSGANDITPIGPANFKGLHMRSGCAISRDGINWTRLQGPYQGALLDRGKDAEFSRFSPPGHRCCATNPIGNSIITPSAPTGLSWSALHFRRWFPMEQTRPDPRPRHPGQFR
jgi:DNA-binding transcriptional ArsR family regulator